MRKFYKSDISAAIHETAKGLYQHGIIDDTSMHKFDESCLAPSILDDKMPTSHCVVDEDRWHQFTGNIDLSKVSD